MRPVLEELMEHLRDHAERVATMMQRLPQGWKPVPKPLPVDVLARVRSQVSVQKAADAHLQAPNLRPFFEMKAGAFVKAGMIVDTRRLPRNETEEWAEAKARTDQALENAAKGHSKVAVQDLRLVRKDCPLYIRATFHLARQLSLTGQFQESIEQYLEYLDEDILDEGAWCNLAGVLLTIGVIGPAQDILKLCLELDPTDEIARTNLMLSEQ